VNDPTIVSMEARNAEHDRLRSEVVRLTQAANTMFAMGYDKAAREIRDHFAKIDPAIASTIEALWIKPKDVTR
jgi:hypothetical protein